MKKYLTLIIIVLIALLSCEKDDICLEDTTPQLIIRFFNNENQTEPKPLTNAYIWAVEKDTLSNYINVTLDSIAIPLNSFENMTKYVIENNAIKDTIEFNYFRNDIFVSRSCGYKTAFENLKIETHTLNWIKNYTIINPTIENETTTHINIFY